MTPPEMMLKARSRFMLDYPWWASLVMRLKFVESDQTPTMETDGRELRWNSNFVAKRTMPELLGLIAHETGHCAFLHIYRRGARDHAEWNAAADLALNPLLRSQGFTLLRHPLEDEEKRFKGMGAEQIYAIRHSEKHEQESPQPGDGENQQPGNDAAPDWPTFTDGDGDGDGNEPVEAREGVAAPSQSDWMLATEMATMRQNAAGTMSEDVVRAVKASHQTMTDWRAILRRFLDQTVPSDYSWARLGKRPLVLGLPMPGVIKQNMPRLGVHIDTSGSIDEDTLALFSRELTTLLHDARPVSLDVVYCDSDIRGTQLFTPDDGEVVLDAKGGGGTLFQPFLDYFEAAEEPPAAVISLTDLENADRGTLREPGYPVLWVTTRKSALEGEFGETVRIEE